MKFIKMMLLSGAAVGMFLGISLVTAPAGLPHAQVANATSATIGNIEPLEPTTEGLDVVLGRIIRTVFWIAMILAFFYFLYAGFQYITAGSNSEQADNGRKGIVNAIIGIVILFISMSLLNFVITRIQSGTGGNPDKPTIQTK